MTVHGNTVNDFNGLSSLTSSSTLPTSAVDVRPRTVSRAQSNVSAAARPRMRRIRSNRHTLVRNASTVLREVATNQINTQAAQVAIRAESQALENSKNATALSLNLRLLDLERTLVE